MTRTSYKINLTILVLFLFIILLSTQSYSNHITPAKVNGSSYCNMGVNLAQTTHYSPEMKFKDLIKVASPFRYFDFSEVEKSNLDENGYVLSIPKGKSQPFISISMMKWRDHTDTTDYVFLYDGNGKFNFFVPGGPQPKIIRSTQGRIEMKIDMAINNLKLRLRSIDPSDYPRNFRLIPLEDSDKKNKPFLNDRFQKLWGKFKVYRHLDTLRINNSKIKHWKDRKKPTQLGGEMAIEDIIQMHNEMKVDVWLLIPHLADEEYIENMAKLVKKNLSQELNVYIEYTNEPWNAHFEQSQWLLKQVSPKYQSKKYNWSQWPAEYGRKASLAVNLFAKHFNDNNRLTRVFNAQMWNMNYIKKAISGTRNLMQSFDAIALGYYIGHDVRNITNQTNDEVINYLIKTSKNEAAEILRKYKKLADKYNVKMIAYEAGQHLQNRKSKPDTARFIEINKHPKMEALYISMADEWYKAGGELIVWFNTAWKTFGILETQGEDLSKSPKYKALNKMLKENGCY